MIGKLTGIIDSFDENSLILDVSGVGYLVHASTNTLATIGRIGDVTSLLVITNVREDAITLYGFASSLEKQWFTLLTSVQGVGAKAGLAILAACPADKLGFVIAGQDKSALTRASGVGPKIATRILTELKDKAGKIEITAGAQGVSAPKSGSESGSSTGQMEQDAVSALTNLGYASSDAYEVIMRIKSEESDDCDLQTLIRRSLKELSV